MAHQRSSRHCVNAGVTASSSTTANIPYSSLGLDDNETADDLGSERLPPLRELIWRRLRRRSAAVQRAEDDNESLRRVDPGVIGSIPPSHPGGHPSNGGQMPVRTHREGLTRMVDQMRIDQATNTGNAGNLTGNNGNNPTTGSGNGTGNGGGLGEGSSPPVVVGNLRNVQSGPPNQGFSLYHHHDPYNHASFRAQYVNRIRPDDPPRSMNFSR